MDRESKERHTSLVVLIVPGFEAAWQRKGWTAPPLSAEAWPLRCRTMTQSTSKHVHEQETQARPIAPYLTPPGNV